MASAYCTVPDIQGEIKGIDFSATGALVTTSTVTGFITEASALVNSYVSQRWVTPITADDESLALMSLYTRTLVVDRVKRILRNKQVTNTDGNQAVRSDGGLTVSEVMKALQGIAAGSMNLSGATKQLPDSGFYSNNQARGQSPTVFKNRRQW